MPRARRSARQSAPRAKYTNDPFELAGVSDESGGEETKSSGSKKKAAKGDDSSSDEEFKDAQEDGDDDDNQDDSDEDVVLEDENDEDDDDDEPASEDGEGAPNSRPKTTPNPRSVKKRHPNGQIVMASDETHSRGTWNPLEHVGKVDHLRLTFGTDERDLLSVVHARDRWSGGVDSTFPTRASLNAAQDLPDYGYGPTFGVDPEGMKREKSQGWDWYYADDAGGRFRKRQRIERLDEDESRRVYLPQLKEKKHTVFIGPSNDQKMFTLGQYDSADFGDAWGKESKGKSDAKSSATPKRKKRRGWLLNMGQKVQGMAWAPNQSGLTQYLAVTTPLLKEQKDAYPDPLKDYAALAFRSSAPYPCALQLWAFKAEKDDSLTKTLDMSFKPRLRLALCTDWGDLRRIAWCPMPREPREEDEEDVMKNVGLLAGIWGDGYVRVIDVKLGRDPGTTEFYKVQSPVFEAKPSSTVCTCVTWLSPSDIAVGCANGFVAVWSIAPVEASPSTPQPYFFQPVHSTYILNITSAYPTHPHLLATTSMDGGTRLSSLIDHHKDMVETTRMRVGSSHLSYSPILHSFLSSDENDFARLLATRRFYTTTAVARLPSTVSAQAPSSFWHPSILYGCTQGTVIATNPLRRLLHPKEKQWQQTWFTHEWVRGKEEESPGTSRFHDGYRAESISLLRNLMGDRKLINGAMIITIFEEGTHVTALSWNPNQMCAGWASAGLGCGLIRVEDLAM